MNPIYIVSTEGDCEGRSIKILGYATGTEADIKEYFKNQAMYRITVSPAIEIITVNAKNSGRQKRLLKEQADAVRRLSEIEAELKDAQ